MAMFSVSLRRCPSYWLQQCCMRSSRSLSVVNFSTLERMVAKKNEQVCPVINTYKFPYVFSREFSKSSSCLVEKQNEEEKVSIFKKFKKMSKDYWYVLVPVHVATSLVWFGGFYAMCKSGVDVAALLQTFGVSDAYVEKLSNSEMGYAALAYACYKIATPVRYTVTVGGTTMTVKYLSDLGYLKTSNQVAEKFKEKADTISQDVKEDIQKWKDRNEKFKDEWTDAWQKFAQKNKNKKN